MTRKRKRKRLHHHVQDYLWPHRRNRYEPGVFSIGSVTVLLAGLLAAMSLYVGHVTVASKSGFFASVVPAALAILTNADRAEAAVGTLQEDPLLAKAAQMKADDMAAKGYFSHVGPTGEQPWEWLKKVGYHYTHAGENLAVDFVDSADVEHAWMNSPTHKANIVKPVYTRIGIGVATGMYQGHETTFVVQFFATPAEAAAKPQSVAAAAMKPAATSPQESTHILGAETTPAAVQETTQETPKAALTVLESAAASPKRTLAYWLLGSLTLLLTLFAIMLAMHAHMRKRSMELIGGGILLTGAIAASLFYVSSAPRVILPEDSQPAAVSQAL